MRKYNNALVNAAGEVLKNRSTSNSQKILEAEDILNYWRFIHGRVLNTYLSTIRTRINNNYRNQGFVAERLKRISSIVAKLERESNMKLSRMQDIAGIRAVLDNIKDVKDLKNKLKNSRAKHILKKENDYINNPKQSGYRSIHLIFQYVNPKYPESNELLIEVQIRTRLQHIWATTVETLGTFLNSSLKASEGSIEILDFLKWTSSAFAIEENCPVLQVHEKITEEEIRLEVIKKYEEYNIENILKGFSVAGEHIEKNLRKNGDNYYLIKLDLENRYVEVETYKQEQLEKANNDYTNIERRIENGEKIQAVLVSTESLNKLQKAYPNYFLDTTDFIKQIDRIRKKLPSKKTPSKGIDIFFRLFKQK